jgi:hypothetical protein
LVIAGTEIDAGEDVGPTARSLTCVRLPAGSSVYVVAIRLSWVTTRRRPRASYSYDVVAAAARDGTDMGDTVNATSATARPKTRE